MRVVSKGNLHNEEKPVKVKCSTCGSILEYTSADIQSDRDGRYVVCPVDNKFIDASVRNIPQD